MTELEQMTPAEAHTVGRLMARAYGVWLGYYRRQGMAPAEAEAQARAAADDEMQARILEGPPDQIGWWDLEAVQERDPDAAQAAWARIKAEVAAEWEGGHRAAAAFGFDGSPWELARFLTVRRGFRAEWQPRGGVEDALIDAAAQAFMMWQQWLERLHTLSSLEGKRESSKAEREGHWTPPTVGTFAAMEQSAAMAERFHRVFLRSVRALRDLRRYPITVQNAGQVNVGAQQVNIAAEGTGRTGTQ